MRTLWRDWVERVIGSETTSRLLHPSLLQDPLVMARGKIQSLVSMSMVLVAPAVALPYFQHGEVGLGVMTLSFGLMFLLAVPLLRFSGNTWLATNAASLALFGSAITGMLVLGGVDSYSTKWLALPALYALTFQGITLGVAWLVVSIASFAAFFSLVGSGVLTPIVVFPAEMMPSIGASNFTVFSFTVFVLLLTVDASHHWMVYQLGLMTKDLEVARDEAIFYGQARERFLANMSHELRTPVTTVIGYAEIIEEELREEGNEGFGDEFEMIRRSGHGLVSMIEDVLEITQMGKELERTEFTLVELDGVFDELGALVRASASERGLDASIVIDPSCVGSSVEADAHMLTRVMEVLIDNACKFTPEGSVALIAHPVVDGEEWVLEVRDDGIGIAAEDLERVWVDFAQVDDSRARAYGGMGLGLGIARRYCDVLGFECELVSSLGEGTRALVRIPADRVIR